MLFTLLAACAASGPPPEPPVPGAAFQHIRSTGVTRTYWLYAPQYEGPRPLLVILHDTGSNGAAILQLTGFASKADSAHFIVAAPNAQGPAFNEGSPGDAASHSDDVAFISNLIDQVRKRHAIDAVFIAGFGSGGAMAQRFALERPAQVDGVAAVAGQVWMPLFKQATVSEKAVPVLLIEGNEDPLNPVTGGKVKSGDALVDVPSPMASIRGWASRYNCTTTVGATVSIVRQTSYYSCQDKVQVVLLSVSGMAHQWPGSPPHDGHTSNLVDRFSATDTIWDFFSRTASAGSPG